jgi:HEAT repeat protein
MSIPESPNVEELKVKNDIQGLIEALYGDWRIQERVAEVLVQMGSSAVEPLIEVLNKALKGYDDQMKRCAAIALGEIGDARAIEPLITLFKTYDEDIDYSTGIALSKIGSPAIEPLIEVFKEGNKHWRTLAVFTLVKISDARAVEPLIALLEKGLTDYSDSDVKRDAAAVLGKMGSLAVEPLIAAALNKEEHYDVRKNVTIALGEIGDMRAVEPLITALMNECETKHTFEVIEAVAEALGKFGDARAVESLIVALNEYEYADSYNARKSGQAVAAAEALGKIGDARAVEPLIAALKHNRVGVREKAAEALKRLGH